ncbi:uncharacterized protein LAESUDRAFT_764929 [Laetiporus sulphureus 93-53]|uniref:Retrotransposon gag domain-containing protein n=1 Tax=Laetiporus sulphureus 93-53 TaxID=1314785 RepID=A0A165B1P7_9APHY|nr:uncharacterized protein LAESUDRAFT_764929 [Laetiporus sulphureus 93-53]KZT00066.1 hypothetical protein LAESUDRAFT_764929 [Laetiporus sulphureus 93-53]
MTTPTPNDPSFSRAPSPELPAHLNIVLQPPNPIIRQALADTVLPNANIPKNVKNWVVDLVTNVVEEMRQQTVAHYENLIQRQAHTMECNTTEFHNRTVFLDQHRQQSESRIADLEKTSSALLEENKTTNEAFVAFDDEGRKVGQGGNNVDDTDDDDEPSFGHKGKGVKIDQPEKYGGNKDGVNLDDWLKQVMLWLKYTGHTKDESKIMSTLLLLKGGAREYMRHWITEINENNKAPGTWAEFVAELRTAYESLDKDDKKRTELEAFIKKDHRDFQKFAEDFRPKATGTGFSDQDLIEKIKKHIPEKTWLLMLVDTTKDNWPKKWTEFLTFALRIFTSLQREGHHAKAETKDPNAMEVDAVGKKGKSKSGKARSVQDDKLVCANCKKNKPTFFKSSKHFGKYCTDCFKLDHVKRQIEKEKETAAKKKDVKKKDDTRNKSKSSKTRQVVSDSTSSDTESESSDTEEEKKPKKKSSPSKTKGKGKETAAHISDHSIHSESEPDASESDEDFAVILSRLRRLRANGSSSSRKAGEGSSRRNQKGFLKGDL